MLNLQLIQIYKIQPSKYQISLNTKLKVIMLNDYIYFE